VRYFALRDLLDRPADDPEVIEARAAINTSHPVKAILDAQYPEGHWVKPGPGYSPKYRSTVWQVIFLDQLGADGSDPRIRAACEYVLSHTQAPSGGFGSSARIDAPHPPDSSIIHCLNGNLLRAMLDFGFDNDERVQHAIEWQARSITGDGFAPVSQSLPSAYTKRRRVASTKQTSAAFNYYKSGTTGPGFACVANYGQPCAWGAIKALRALAHVPESARTPQVKKAIRVGVEFLLSRDLAKAAYPAGDGRISSSWFKLGFPSGYVADVLQNLEVLAELGHGRSKRLKPAIEWLLSKQDKNGRWKNQYSYSGKLWADIEPQGSVSKWVTLRACRVLKAAV
jgi:hypothetical protein